MRSFECFRDTAVVNAAIATIDCLIDSNFGLFIWQSPKISNIAQQQTAELSVLFSIFLPS